MTGYRPSTARCAAHKNVRRICARNGAPNSTSTKCTSGVARAVSTRDNVVVTMTLGLRPSLRALRCFFALSPVCEAGAPGPGATDPAGGRPTTDAATCTTVATPNRPASVIMAMLSASASRPACRTLGSPVRPPKQRASAASSTAGLPLRAATASGEKDVVEAVGTKEGSEAASVEDTDVVVVVVVASTGVTPRRRRADDADAMAVFGRECGYDGVTKELGCGRWRSLAIVHSSVPRFAIVVVVFVV
ncbi:uncharacterized protein SPSK_03609 [Sporothrix schenckii 1099-18]|uniref:Uncharacterized protein n=1 Tax=Sporothrix schenckii 1099-18 TaxID=1397361 RepID=A0A0F2LZE2_SPOSC|nr:uncharacterized protein SPSK_03609 [Sporothrix schenckii 1099-18]KJR82199.1 hypothetical protein SPSK_03609 [Sporothrix schenckii 1099-18]